MSDISITNQLVGRQEVKVPKDSTRAELAACAAQFFAKQGYYGTSTQTIAEFCNIRKASLFHHYKTKEDIALAAIQFVLTECKKNIFKHLEDQKISTQQRAINFFQAAEEFFAQRGEALLPTLLGLELSDAEFVTDAIRNYFLTWQDALTRLLTPLCANSTIAKQMAQQILTRMQGHLVTARIQKNPQYITALFTELRKFWTEASQIS